MPDLHPFVVHFPIALLTVSTVAELLSAVVRKDSLSSAGWWMQLFGVLGIAAAALSGIAAGQRVTATGEALDHLTLHSQLAFLAASLWAGLLLWRIARKTHVPRPKVLYLALMVAATILLMHVGFLGGELVFLHRIGVAP